MYVWSFVIWLSTEEEFLEGNKPTRCLLDRARSLAINVLPSNGEYMPKCTGDGDYQPVQCHDALGQCWCVDKYGNELHGTRQTGGTPDCNDTGWLFRVSFKFLKVSIKCFYLTLACIKQTKPVYILFLFWYFFVHCRFQVDSVPEKTNGSLPRFASIWQLYPNVF